MTKTNINLQLKMDNPLESPSKPILSLCMIVRNEAENLPRCLDSVKAYVDELIIVDTGSQDGTPEVALKYGAKVRYFEWCDDFAAARNYALSQASGDWILVLDADEELVVESESFLENIKLNSEAIAYSLELQDINDLSPKTPSYLLRLFRNSSDILYLGRFHEQLSYQNQYISLSNTEYLQGIRIRHYGYYQEQAKQKSTNRNIPILERMGQEEGLSLMHLYCLAQMYSISQQPEKLEECYAEAFERLKPNFLEGNAPEDVSLVPSLVYALGMQFVERKDYETAKLVCQRGIEWYPSFPPLQYLAGVILSHLGFPLGATAYFKNCIQLGKEGKYYQREAFDLIFTTTHPAYNLGCMYIALQRWADAINAFELALGFNPDFTAAKDKINQIRQFIIAPK